MAVDVAARLVDPLTGQPITDLDLMAEWTRLDRTIYDLECRPSSTERDAHLAILKARRLNLAGWLRERDALDGGKADG